MRLSGLHLLLTCQCNYSCDHCFVWGDPFQSGTMTLQQIGRILDEGENHGSVKSIYFEGGEPFLYYPVMVRGIRMAAKRGFSVGVVTNGYWATGREDAVERRWNSPAEPPRGRGVSLPSAPTRISSSRGEFTSIPSATSTSVRASPSVTSSKHRSRRSAGITTSAAILSPDPCTAADPSNSLRDTACQGGNPTQMPARCATRPGWNCAAASLKSLHQTRCTEAPETESGEEF